MATTFSTKRLGNELRKLQTTTLPPGITLVSAGTPHLNSPWTLDITIPPVPAAATNNNTPHPIYSTATFRLQFTFPRTYPVSPPEVIFLSLSNPPRPVPLHPHIYSNGIICLDLLAAGEGWSPILNVESVALSLQSMLAGNMVAERPEGDEEFVHSGGAGGVRPRDVRFVYHDESC